MRYFLLIILFFVSNQLMAQETTKVDSSNNTALEKNIYLEKEKTILKQIEIALQLKEYERAETLTKELKLLQNNFYSLKSKISKNGLFIDVLTGISNNRFINSNTTSNFGGSLFSLRFGNKWYLGKKKKYNYGIQCTYLRIGVALNNKWKTTSVDYSIANLGFINAFDFGNNHGLELNINGGFKMYTSFNSISSLMPGVVINPELKYRFNKFAFGLDYTISNIFVAKESSINTNSFSFSFGAKF